MKKLLGILVLGLLWCNTSFAGCKDYVEFTWKYTDDNIAILMDGSLQDGFRYSTQFKNPSKNEVIIKKVELLSADKEIMFTQQLNITLEPYHEDHANFLASSGLMHELVNSVRMHCVEN